MFTFKPPKNVARKIKNNVSCCAPATFVSELKLLVKFNFMCFEEHSVGVALQKAPASPFGPVLDKIAFI